MKTKLLIATLFLGITTLYAQNIPSYVPKDGLVGYWPFNGNANDESGNGNNGTVNGANLTAGKTGISNTAYQFTSTSNNYIALNQPFFNGGQQSVFSMFARVYANNISNNPNIWGKAFYWGEVNFQLNNDGSASIAWANTVTGNKYSSIVTNPGLIQNGQWYDILIVYNNSSGTIYVNGTAVPTQLGWNVMGTTQIESSCNFAQDNGTSRFGTRLTSGSWGNYFDGKFDEFGLWDRALTQQEITALYSGTPASPLTSTKVFVDAPASVNENENVEVSISTETLNTADNVIAFQTDLAYDTTRYTFVSKNLTGTINPTGNALVNSTKNGKLNISYMSQTALNGAGSLVKLTFKANKTLGQGIFSLSNFLYNTTAVTSLKSDTVNTLDVTPPSARIHYSQNPVRKGDSLLITVKYSEKIAVNPVPQLNLSGQNTLSNSNLTKVNDTTYTYWWVVEKGNGAVNVSLATGKDLAGNNVIATPTQNASFTVLPTLFGDIDTNKLVQAYDAALVLQYSVGLNPLPTMDALPWSNWRIVVANVDTVGNVTANDASLILQHSAKLITTFPADAKKRADAPIANITVTQEANQLVFRATGTLYAFNVFMKDNFNAFGQPEVKDKNAMVATNISATTYNVGLASTTPFAENEPFLVIPIITNDNIQGTMDMVANTQEKALAYGKAASITSHENDALVVYPNPTKDVVTIHNAQGKTVKIVDVQGKEVYNAVLPTAKTEISLKAFGKTGVYVLHVVDANNASIQTKQIVLE